MLLLGRHYGDHEITGKQEEESEAKKEMTFRLMLLTAPFIALVSTAGTPANVLSCSRYVVAYQYTCHNICSDACGFM